MKDLDSRPGVPAATEPHPMSVSEHAEVHPPVRKALQIAWPSFLMAGVLEALVFSVVDPSTLRWFGGTRIEWSAQAVHTLSFFVFWLVIALSAGISHALMAFRGDVRIGA